MSRAQFDEIIFWLAVLERRCDKVSLAQMAPPAFVILIICFASIALADDFKTYDGKEYKNATVRRVEPDGIVVATKGTLLKLYFTELPKDVQERFHYDPASAAAAQAAAVRHAGN